jgi:hypothetical protein
MEFEQGKVDSFKDLFSATRHKIASFEGCKAVKLLNEVHSPNVFFTHSLWESEEALENYRRSELFKDTWAKTKAMFSNKAQAWSLKEVK